MSSVGSRLIYPAECSTWVYILPGLFYFSGFLFKNNSECRWCKY